MRKPGGRRLRRRRRASYIALTLSGQGPSSRSCLPPQCGQRWGTPHRRSTSTCSRCCSSAARRSSARQCGHSLHRPTGRRYTSAADTSMKMPVKLRTDVTSMLAG